MIHRELFEWFDRWEAMCDQSLLCSQTHTHIGMPQKRQQVFRSTRLAIAFSAM